MSAAWRAIGAATHASSANVRYADAHLAALRAAAAVLAARAGAGRRARVGGVPPRASAWILLARVAPELREWSDFFDVSSRVLQAVQAGTTSGAEPRLSDRQADDLLRDAERFLTEVRSLLLGDRGG